MTTMTPQTDSRAQAGFLNLGEITDALTALPETMPAFVMMGGELLSPDGVATYRGRSMDLAIEPVNPTFRRTVGDLLGCLEDADGRVFEGSRIHRGSAVCVSRYTSNSEDYVTAVEVRSGVAVVVTRQNKD